MTDQELPRCDFRLGEVPGEKPCREPAIFECTCARCMEDPFRSCVSHRHHVQLSHARVFPGHSVRWVQVAAEPMTSGPAAQSDLCEACHKAPVDVCLDNTVTAVTEHGERMLVKLGGKARVTIRLCGECLSNMGTEARDVLEDNGLDVADMVAKAQKGPDS